ncbi:hypothetical protein EZS27_001232 [termite gut metagenome]|uniref:Tetratricopeptide repeat protein n=1 Tax=termite gut metagenome TaxID=433724 RepID=A0A5J4T1A7_9ZZZZ
MSKNLFSLVLILLFASCGSIEQFNIDYMVPACISFPSQLKRVAIVNNVSDTLNNWSIPQKNTPGANGLLQKTAYYDGLATLVAESFAEHIAAANYFEEVLICDSALRASDIIPRESTLSKKEVEELTESLGVDAIFSMENLLIKSVNTTTYISDERIFHGTLDVLICPTVSIYIPNRNKPVRTINASDSIFWEKYDNTQTSVAQVIPHQRLIKEITDFAGSIPVKYLTPYRETANRFIYTNGSSDLRDAAICVRNDQWDRAYELWKRVNQSKKDKLQMYAALNIAVYHEIAGNIDEALKWVTIARDIAQKIVARKIDKTTQKSNTLFVNGTPSHYYYISLYMSVLEARAKNLTKLNMQMDRVK